MKCCPNDLLATEKLLADFRRTPDGAHAVKRPDSQFWRVRLQLNGKSKEISLRTSDKLEAERLALPIIAEHKAALLAKRPRLEPSFSFKHPPGEHVQPSSRN